MLYEENHTIQLHERIALPMATRHASQGHALVVLCSTEFIFCSTELYISRSVNGQAFGPRSGAVLCHIWSRLGNGLGLQQSPSLVKLSIEQFTLCNTDVLHAKYQQPCLPAVGMFHHSIGDANQERVSSNLIHVPKVT